MRRIVTMLVVSAMLGILFGGCARRDSGGGSDELKGTWLDKSGGVPGEPDGAGGVAFGSVLAAGTVVTSTAPPVTKIAARRLDEESGSLQYSVLVDSGTLTPYQAGKVCSDSAGNLYIAGQVNPGGTSDGFVVRLNADGTEAWTFPFAGAAGLADRMNACAFGPDGFLYVVGTESLTLTDSRVVVRRHDPASGTPTAFAVIDEAGPDEGLGIAVDSSGNVYVSGSAGGDLLVAKFNPAGTVLLWSNVQDGGFGLADQMAALKLDSSGKPIVCGRVRRSVTDTAWVVRKHDAANGAVLWQQVYDPSAGEDEARGLFVDSSGQSYVVGTIAGTSDGKNVGILKFDANGNRVFVHGLHSGFGDDEGVDLLVDGSGNLFVAGTAPRATGDIEMFVTRVPVFQLPASAAAPSSTVAQGGGSASDFVQTTGNAEQQVTGVKTFTGAAFFDSLVTVAGLSMLPGSPVNFLSNPVKGFVAEQLTADPTTASAVEEGRLIWRKDTNTLKVWDGSGWVNVAAPGGSLGGSGALGQVGFFTASQTLSSDAGLFWDNAAKRLGIGMTLPGSRFQVQGSTSDSTASALNATNSAASSLFFVRNDGNVGIGTTSPVHLMHIVGPVPQLKVQTSAGSSATAALITDSFTGPSLYSIRRGGAIGWQLGMTTTDSRFRIDDPGGTSRLVIDNTTGNVGIGTTGPGTALDVRKDGGDATLDALYLQNIHDGASAFVGLNFRHIGTDLAINDAVTLVAGKDERWTSVASTRDGYLAISTRLNNALGERVRIDSSGNVGIGTTGPVTNLHIENPTGSQQGFRITKGGVNVADLSNSNSAGSRGTLTLYEGGVAAAAVTAGGTSYFNGGNVGIGTTGPGAPLDVRADLGTGVGTILQIRNTNPAAISPGASLDFYSGTLNTAQLQGIRSNVNVGSEGRFVLKALKGSGATMTPYLSTGGGGAVFIGPDDPGAGLTHGSSGLVVTGGANLGATAAAQDYPSRLRIQPGEDNNIFLAFDQTGVQAVTGPAAAFGNLLLNPRGGNVGIGTAGPGARLHARAVSTGDSANDVVARFTKDSSFQGALDIAVQNSHMALMAMSLTGGGHAVSMGFYTRKDGVEGVVEKMRVASDGNVGIGTTSPGAPLAVNRSADGTIVEFESADVVQGSVSIAGATTSYNAFTGSHYAWSDQPLERGMVLSMTGLNKRLHRDPDAEIVYGVEKSRRPNDPKILGAYLSLENPSEDASESNPQLVMAVGNGEMWVVDMGENLEPGEHLISSGVPGHAMKEDGTYRAAHVIARIAERVDWRKVTETIDDRGTPRKHKKISVLFESFVKTSQNQLEELKAENAELKARLGRLERILAAE